MVRYSSPSQGSHRDLAKLPLFGSSTYQLDFDRVTYLKAVVDSGVLRSERGSSESSTE
jgi:hypothetical protein